MADWNGGGRTLLGNWVETLYKSPKFERMESACDAGEVIRWWESRRLFFNLVVGCTGLFTCFLLIVCAFTSDFLVGEAIGMTDGPLLGVFLIVPYALVANLCFTGGWIFELLVRATGEVQRAAAWGLKAFRVGITFSIFVTLCPAVVCWLVFAVALLKGQKHGPPGE